jgi:hypothetical protein
LRPVTATSAPEELTRPSIFITQRFEVDYETGSSSEAASGMMASRAKSAHMLASCPSRGLELRPSHWVGGSMADRADRTKGAATGQVLIRL